MVGRKDWGGWVLARALSRLQKPTQVEHTMESAISEVVAYLRQHPEHAPQTRGGVLVITNYTLRRWVSAAERQGWIRVRPEGAHGRRLSSGKVASIRRVAGFNLTLKGCQEGRRSEPPAPGRAVAP